MGKRDSSNHFALDLRHQARSKYLGDNNQLHHLPNRRDALQRRVFVPPGDGCVELSFSIADNNFTGVLPDLDSRLHSYDTDVSNYLYSLDFNHISEGEENFDVCQTNYTASSPSRTNVGCGSLSLGTSLDPRCVCQSKWGICGGSTICPPSKKSATTLKTSKNVDNHLKKYLRDSSVLMSAEERDRRMKNFQKRQNDPDACPTYPPYMPPPGTGAPGTVESPSMPPMVPPSNAPQNPSSPQNSPNSLNPSLAPTSNPSAPVSSSSSSCPPPIPVAGEFECVDGVWKSLSDVSTIKFFIPSKGRVYVDGNLTVETIIFDGTDSRIDVNGNITIKSKEVTFILRSGDVTKINKDSFTSVYLVSSTENNCAQCTDLTSLKVRKTGTTKSVQKSEKCGRIRLQPFKVDEEELSSGNFRVRLQHLLYRHHHPNHHRSAPPSVPYHFHRSLCQKEKEDEKSIPKSWIYSISID